MKAFILGWFSDVTVSSDFALYLKPLIHYSFYFAYGTSVTVNLLSGIQIIVPVKHNRGVVLGLASSQKSFTFRWQENSFFI